MSTIEEAREQARAALSEDGFFNREQATIVRALLDATEPPKPAEDEREALVNVIRLFFQNWRAIGKVPAALEVSIDSLEGAVDDLIELDAPNDGDYHEGFEEGVKVGRAGSGPRPITDEMVERAISAHRFTNAFGPEEVTRMRAALEAAEEARR